MEQILPTSKSAELFSASSSRLALSRESIQRLSVIALALIALSLKLAIAFNTIGTNDVITFYQFGRNLHEHGLEWTYEHSSYFNHPPLIAYSLNALYWLNQQPVIRSAGLTFPFLLRLPGIAADFITVLALCAMNDGRSGLRMPPWALWLLAASPVSIMVSGFHGNSDPLLVMFLVLACLFVLRDKSGWCGLFLACSCQIKIVSLLFVPIFFFFWSARRRAISFSLPLVTVSLLLWSDPLLHYPLLFFKNVLSYGSFSGIWGITYCLRLAGLSPFQAVTFHNFSAVETCTAGLLKLAIVIAVLIIAWRRRTVGARALLDSIGYGWIVFFVLAPGVCAQYLVWLAPFVLFLSPTMFIWVTASSSVFLFAFYNITAGGLPWYLAVSTDKLNSVWAPWGLWLWMTLIAALLLSWKNAFAMGVSSSSAMLAPPTPCPELP